MCLQPEDEVFHGQDVVYNDLGEEMLLHAFDGKPAKLQAMVLISDGSSEHYAHVVWSERYLFSSTAAVFFSVSLGTCPTYSDIPSITTGSGYFGRIWIRMGILNKVIIKQEKKVVIFCPMLVLSRGQK